MTRTPSPRTAGTALLLVGLLGVAACGSNDPDTVGTRGNGSGNAAPASPLVAIESAPPRADGVDLTQPFGAQVPKAMVTGEFTLLDTAPPGHESLAGRATLDRSDAGTVVDVSLTGVKPDTEIVGHVHTQPCAQDQGGPHFRFDPAGAAEPPNEIHLMFTSAADGSGGASASNPMIVPESARSVVVHEATSGGDPVKIACADLR